MTLNGNNIKISFSDNGKRRDILGDESGYELTEKTCKLLHISLNKNSQVAPENILKDIFKKYGYVKGLHVKNNIGFRPSIYVEYNKTEEAENAINQLMTQDLTGEKRKLIGDPSCEINFYFKKKIYFNQNNPFENMTAGYSQGNNNNFYNQKINLNPNNLQGMNMNKNPYLNMNNQMGNLNPSIDKFFLFL